mmetsp:Transcript_63868/g.152323  ORF Transcript_63868/g.152323 Transcript_63868/m.152323 type:complete len:209 (+) Transcript_63868:94-720(+)
MCSVSRAVIVRIFLCLVSFASFMPAEARRMVDREGLDQIQVKLQPEDQLEDEGGDAEHLQRDEHRETQNKTDVDYPFKCIEEGHEIGKVDVHCSCPSGGKLQDRPDHHCEPNGCGPDDPNLLAQLGNLLYPDVKACCDTHDIEYCTCGYTKMFADIKLMTCMRDICSKKEWTHDWAQCTAKTEAAAYGVLKWGTSAYKAAQDKACFCP